MQTSSDTLTPAAPARLACQSTKATLSHVAPAPAQATSFDALLADLAARAVLTGFYEANREEIDSAISLRRIA